ncbi:MAG TPA: Hsp20/alpha crystallin family protein, partial [Candidatus Binatia bacterium]|nr:Hsp20/alpha crystallin family protein [Candidatus Binatia bacterium]
MARIEKETKGLARPPSITGMTSWEQEVQRIFGDFFARSLRPFENEHRRKPFSYGGSAPAVDLYEKRNEVVVKAELPGMEKDDIEIKFRNHQLTIKGEKKREEDAEEADYYIAER